MVDSQQGAKCRVGYNHLIPNKHEWNNLLKMPTKYREFFVKTTNFQLVFNFEQRHTIFLPYWRAWYLYNGSYTMMAKPIRALE